MISACLAALLAISGCLSAAGAASFMQHPVYFESNENGVLTLTGTTGQDLYEAKYGGGTWTEPRVVRLNAHVENVEDLSVFALSQVEEYQVDKKNPYFKAVDGVLFTKDGKTLLMFPSARRGRYEVPAGTQEIALDAFWVSHPLEEVTIPEGIKTLGAKTTEEYGELPAKRLKLPASLEQLNMQYLTGDLESVEVAAENPAYETIDGVLFHKGEKRLLYYSRHRQNIHYDVPEGTRSIGEYAFRHNPWLESCALPRSMETLMQGAFAGCTALRSVALPITLKTIQKYAFGDCVNLKQILPPPACVVEEDGFYNCPALGMFPGEDNPAPAQPPSTYSKTQVYGVLNPENARDTVPVLRDLASQEVLARFPCGGLVMVERQEGAYYKVFLEQFGNEARVDGYVEKRLVQVFNSYCGLFQPSYFMLRKGLKQAPLYANTYADSRVTGEERQVRAGEKMLALEEWPQQGQWFQVITEGYADWGYLWAGQVTAFAKDIPPGKTYGVVIADDARDRLHLREAPRQGGQSLGKFFSGAQVDILEDAGDWYRVRVGIQEGYMMKKFIEVVQRAEERE